MKLKVGDVVKSETGAFVITSLNQSRDNAMSLISGQVMCLFLEGAEKLIEIGEWRKLSTSHARLLEVKCG